MPQQNRNAARRAAPRRSPRPRRRFRRAASEPATMRRNRTPTANGSKTASCPVGSETADRGGRDHGPVSSKKTGLPARAAASTRIARSGRFGLLSAQASRLSAKNGGSHRGSVFAKSAASRPASEKREDQSGAAAGAGAGEDGTASKRVSRPTVSSSTPIIPLRDIGGSDSERVHQPKPSPRKRSGIRREGLWRYQK